MNQVDINTLQGEVQEFLNIFEAHAESNSHMTWKPSDGFLPVVFRAIFRRQYESLQTISQLAITGNGAAAGPLLRPACEEFIWTKYLTQISARDAEQLVICFAMDEQYKNLRVQDEFAGRSVTETLGLLPYLERSNKIRKDLLQKIRKLGERLDWPENTITQGQLPPIWWLAETTEEQSTFDFIYHATSRFVHFSVAELLRRAWGNPYKETLSVNSIHFRDYWAYFCLYWGLFLFLCTVIEILGADSELIEMGMSDADAVKVLEIMERVGNLGKPPIITAEELEWPSR